MKTSISKVMIDAPAANVWAALTQPAQVKLWQYGSELQTEWKVGGPIQFVNEWNGERFVQHGTVLAFEPDRLAQYSLFAPRPGTEDTPAQRFTMSYELRESDGRTEVAIVQADPREPLDETIVEQGENPILQALKALVENGPAA